MNIKQLKQGDFFKKNETSKIIWVRGEYVASVKKYSCYKFDDINTEQFFSGSKEVFTDFTF